MVTEKMIEAAKAEYRECVFLTDEQVHSSITRIVKAALSTDAEPVGWLVKRYNFNGVLFDTELSFVRPTISRTCKTEMMPLYAAPPAPSVAVKALEWKETEFHDGPNKTLGATATEPHSAWYFVNHYKGGWRISFEEDAEIHPTFEEAKATAQTDYEARILSALSAQVQDMAGLERLKDITYAVQHSPNCPAKFLVRLVGKSGVIDLKPYGGPFTFMKNDTTDILGFGKTIDEAIDKALAAAKLEEKP